MKVRRRKREAQKEEFAGLLLWYMTMGIIRKTEMWHGTTRIATKM